ncbi:hypothetical protein NMK71_11730, partial [Weeksellaceae bacterium KMM 9713]
KAQRTVAMTARIVAIRGIVYNAEGAASITADLIEAVKPELLSAADPADRAAAQLGSKSRDFR